MSTWSIDARFDKPANAGVLAFLRRARPSAHSDVSEELLRAAEGVESVRSYCPDPGGYAFVALHDRDGTFVGLAYGMAALAFRLDGEREREALAEGGRPAPELGVGWVCFEPWSGAETLGQSRGRLARWCAAAAGPR